MLSDDDVLAYIGIYNMLFTVPGVYRWFFLKCNFFVKDSLYWQTDFDHSQNPFDVNPCSMALTGRVWGTPFDIVSIPLDFMQSKPSLVYSGISCSFFISRFSLEKYPTFKFCKDDNVIKLLYKIAVLTFRWHFPIGLKSYVWLKNMLCFY